jgi:hypothetical protein
MIIFINNFKNTKSITNSYGKSMVRLVIEKVWIIYPTLDFAIAINNTKS